jgi:HPt (histidine-containing phosphotransfer) domain-containing protein
MKDSLARKQDAVIAFPEARGGSSTIAVSHAEETRPRRRVDKIRLLEKNFAKTVAKLQDDANYQTLSLRMKSFTAEADSLLLSIKSALQGDDREQLAAVAHTLTEQSGRLGAMQLMKIGIALQMLSRSGLMEQVAKLVDELEVEYDRYKDGLII